MLARDGSGGMNVDSGSNMAGFSHEVRPNGLAGATDTMADKIKQRNKLLETYASKALQQS